LPPNRNYKLLPCISSPLNQLEFCSLSPFYTYAIYLNNNTSNNIKFTLFLLFSYINYFFFLQEYIKYHILCLLITE
jgi:hypothetical protein